LAEPLPAQFAGGLVRVRVRARARVRTGVKVSKQSVI
jgi:hypothetical protein|tara:strand:- start:438 stop:548 length:111 start_codon:yes stop_codon:yes gene_type:complete